MAAAVHNTLARLQIDVPPAQPVPSSPFILGDSSSFPVPLSEEYVVELHTCWIDTISLSLLLPDGRALAVGQKAEVKMGLIF